MARVIKGLRIAGLAALSAFVPAAGCEEDVGEGDQPGQHTVRVSINRFEQEVKGTLNGSESASLSSDGRFVAFQSDAPNLVASDGNNLTDIFVKDRATGAVELVSLNTFFGIQATRHCFQPSISADGRYVAFQTDGLLSLGAGDDPELKIYVHDRQTRTTSRIINSAINPDGVMFSPAISGDGRFIVFVSNATNLDPGSTNAGADFQIYRSEWQALPNPVITLVSGRAAAITTGTTGGCDRPSLSFDGSRVAFTSDGTDLFVGDVAGFDVFLANPPGTPVQLVSRLSGAAGTPANDQSGVPWISSDGNSVVFETSAPNIVGGAGSVIAVRQVVAPFNTTVVSLDGSGVQIPGPQSPTINSDGSIVAFSARATPPQTPLFLQIWVVGAPGGPQLASVHLSGAQSNEHSLSPSISGDGQWVGFHTRATNLILRDANGQNDIYVRGPLR